MSTSRKLLLMLWLVAPALVLAWHVGPGRRQQLYDQAAGERERSHAAAAKGDWRAAAALAGEALATLAQAEAIGSAGSEAPSGEVKLAATEDTAHALSPAAAALTLDQARARLRAGELPEGIEQLDALVERIGADPANAAIVPEARHELAAASYAAAWLMRLEGASAEEWMIDAELARQQFRMLAERGGAVAAPAQSNLEATVRLERMDLDELQGLALPKDCKCNSKNLSQRRRHQRESKGKPNPSQSPQREKPDDARDEVKKAGQQARGEGEGS